MSITLVARAAEHGNRVALLKGDTEVTYTDLLTRSSAAAAALLGIRDDLEEDCIGYLIAAGADYVATQWGIWQAGGVAVPLSLSATADELAYAIDDAGISQVVAASEFTDRVEPLCRERSIPLHGPSFDSASNVTLPALTSSRRAIILYTSGTTSRPKGVVSTHAMIEAQITSLIEAWRWETDDRIPLFLPLHHIHGIINVLSCGLWAGGTVDAMPRFDLPTVLSRVAAGRYTVFMAVPTIYVKLIEALDAMSDDERLPILDGFRAMRLMVSGSAALPASVHRRWQELTGQPLLERYGMTEIGMALSNPYDGERRPGAVGQPLPGVEMRLHQPDDNAPGEIEVRGPGVFTEYWNKPDATAAAFAGGWFRTGDIAVREGTHYRIMGRSSVDIIKSGGYKLSALEIETALLDHPAIREVAVVGLPDDTWGESVAAAVVTTEPLALDALQSWARERISHYKMPRRLLVVDSLPRNAMGKVTKPAVTTLFTD